VETECRAGVPRLVPALLACRLEELLFEPRLDNRILNRAQRGRCAAQERGALRVVACRDRRGQTCESLLGGERQDVVATCSKLLAEVASGALQLACEQRDQA
jgi:hypothetical protein